MFKNEHSVPLSATIKWRVGSAIIVLPTLFLAIILLQPLAEPKWMFLDTLAAAELSGDCCHVYYGFVSNAGLLLWSGTAAVCLLLGLCFQYLGGLPALTRFALSAGALTGWIALDDMFLLHEKVFPALGIPQTLVVMSYLGLGLIYALANWRFILGQEFWILGLGGSALVVSIGVDTIFHSLVPALVYLEDGAKFFGIFCWMSFHLLTLFAHLTHLLSKQVTKRVVAG